MQTAAQRPVLPVVSDNTTVFLSVQPQAGGKTSYDYAATALTFNPSTNVITMNVVSSVSLNTATLNVSSSISTGSVNVATGSNVFVGTTRIESQVPHPFLLSFL
jgi:phage baseplate assembly protein gpV